VENLETRITLVESLSNI